MSFPPPLRFLVPMLLLVFGLTAIWLDYRLNLSNDLERNFSEVVAQADVAGKRLAKLSEQPLLNGDISALQKNFRAWNDEPWLRIVALVDDHGRIIADSEARWAGQPARDTPASPAMKIVERATGATAQKATHRHGEVRVVGAHPVPLGEKGRAWVLVVFDRTDAVAQAQADALRQLGWGGSVIGVLCLALWAVLHFYVAARLARLERSVKDLGERKTRFIEPLPGGDEIHRLSKAFATMSRQLFEREQERTALEREVIDSTERERRRIGHELHDGVGQQLTAALMASNGIIDDMQKLGPAFATKAENLSLNLRNTIGEVRALSHGLAPVPMWEGGLEHALQALAESTQRSAGLRCVLECLDPLDDCGQEVAGNLYRIAQEAVNNALKHAGPNEIRIGLEQRDGCLVLEVDDDGAGLSETLADGGGIGFRIMRHRAEVMGGRFDFGAAPAGGTRIAVHIPLSK